MKFPKCVTVQVKTLPDMAWNFIDCKKYWPYACRGRFKDCNTVSVQDKGHISWISFLEKEMSRLTVN